jgi:hypothetical protein
LGDSCSASLILSQNCVLLTPALPMVGWVPGAACPPLRFPGSGRQAAAGTRALAVQGSINTQFTRRNQAIQVASAHSFVEIAQREMHPSFRRELAVARGDGPASTTIKQRCAGGVAAVAERIAAYDLTATLPASTIGWHSSLRVPQQPTRHEVGFSSRLPCTGDSRVRLWL